MEKKPWESRFFINKEDSRKIGEHFNYLAEGDGDRYEQIYNSLSDKSEQIKRFRGPNGDDWSGTHMTEQRQGTCVCVAILYSSDNKRLIEFFKRLEVAKREGGMNGREKDHLMGFKDKLYLEKDSVEPDGTTCMAITGKKVTKLFGPRR